MRTAWRIVDGQTPTRVIEAPTAQQACDLAFGPYEFHGDAGHDAVPVQVRNESMQRCFCCRCGRLADLAPTGGYMHIAEEPAL